MGKSKKKKARNDIISTTTPSTPPVASVSSPTLQQTQLLPQTPQQSQLLGNNEYRQQPSRVARDTLRFQLQGSPLQPGVGGNQATGLKIKFLSKVAEWAANAVPPLGAFFGERLAFACESAETPSPLLNSQCETCETVLLPGVNCSVRVLPRPETKKKRKKAKAGAPAVTLNKVVYRCQFCKHGRQTPGTPKKFIATKLAQAAARAQMRDLASSALTTNTPPSIGKMQSAGSSDNHLSTPEMSHGALSRAVDVSSIDTHGSSSKKKKKRKGWTGLKAIVTAQAQYSELPNAERFSFVEKISSPLNPKKRTRT